MQATRRFLALLLIAVVLPVAISWANPSAEQKRDDIRRLLALMNMSEVIYNEMMTAGFPQLEELFFTLHPSTGDEELDAHTSWVLKGELSSALVVHMPELLEALVEAYDTQLEHREILDAIEQAERPGATPPFLVLSPWRGQALAEATARAVQQASRPMAERIYDRTIAELTKQPQGGENE